MAFFEVCFLAAWLTRDAIYLQWMNVRRGRNHSLPESFT